MSTLADTKRQLDCARIGAELAVELLPTVVPRWTDSALDQLKGFVCYYQL